MFWQNTWEAWPNGVVTSGWTGSSLSEWTKSWYQTQGQRSQKLERINTQEVLTKQFPKQWQSIFKFQQSDQKNNNDNVAQISVHLTHL